MLANTTFPLLFYAKEAAHILVKQRWMGKELVQMPFDFISILMHSQQAGYVSAVKSRYVSKFFCTLKSGDVVVEAEGKTKKEAHAAASRALIALLAEAGDEDGNDTKKGQEGIEEAIETEIEKEIETEIDTSNEDSAEAEEVERN